MDLSPAQASEPTVDPSNKSLQLASEQGAPLDMNPYLVIERPNSSIPARGRLWSQVLNSSGIVNHVFNVEEVLAQPALLRDVPAVLVDGSLGSGNGSLAPSSFLRLLISNDAPLILTGRAAWILHELRATGLPTVTAAVSKRLLTSPGYEAATFLHSPIELSISSLLTEETTLQLPVDTVQSEHSRIVDLTGPEHPAEVAMLRYDSYPLDTFLLCLEDPAKMTGQGRGLLINTIAFATSLRETQTTKVVSELQAVTGDSLAGGFFYTHEPTLKAAYAAVHSAKSVSNDSSWLDWRSQYYSLIQRLLDSLFVDYGSQAGFMNSVSENTVGIESTAEGLWLAAAMGQTTRYDSSKLVSYLSSRQDGAGGFGNHITITYYAVEALALSGHLGSINTVNLESWLRSCIIDGTKTSNPDLWGAVGQNPTSTSPKNSYATEYVLSLQSLGKSHHDPVKLTNWIRTRTSNADGSYKEVLGVNGELVTGTSSALATMAIMNTLSLQNRTSGLFWLAANQLPSGGFGLTEAASDWVGKISPTLSVSLCIQTLGGQSATTATEILSFLELCGTDLGFEPMEPIPSLMWSHWLSLISRLSHSGGFTDFSLLKTYADALLGWPQYPSNVTAAIAIEYGSTQYRMQSAWTQYLGVAMYAAIGSELQESSISATESYLYQCQDSTGHYKTTSFMGTPHIQNTVAAVEALYLMNSLGTIRYRTNLESAILAQYVSGHWSMEGWTLRPFVAHQSSIDWLCTRAAVRLGLLDSVKAQQIAQCIRSRIQYSDIWALSRDVATLALLNASGFSVNLECIDTQAVIQSLGSTPFSNGWLNSTELWQPVYTAGTLEMISVLGLRTRIANPSSSSIGVTGPSTAEIGSSLTVGLSITPISGNHDVLVFSFGRWLHIRDVHDVDSISLDVPCNQNALGSHNISIALWDFGVSRGYCVVPLQVHGTFQGNLSIPAPRVPRGRNITGSVDWSLNAGAAAGQTNVRIIFGNGQTHQEWDYSTEPPLSFSISTGGCPAGFYNLTVQLEKPWCQTLVLSERVAVLEPVLTYLSSSLFIRGEVKDTVSIVWSLRFSCNGSAVRFQQVGVVIRDESRRIVFERSATVSPFAWIPDQRGNYTFVLSFSGNDSLVESFFTGAIGVYENVLMEWQGAQTQNQHLNASYAVKLRTESGTPLSGYTVHVTVTSPSSVIVLQTQLVTNSTGFVTVSFTLSENGVYLLEARISDTGFLVGCSATQGLVSWSSSSLQVGGITPDAPVETQWNLWARLTDSYSVGVAGTQVTMCIIFLPSAIVLQQTLTTNSTGYISFQWSGSTAGSYRLEAEFSGSLSRGSSVRSTGFVLRIPLTLVVTLGANPEVGHGSWIELSVFDHRHNPVAGLTVTVEVRGSYGETVYRGTVITENMPVRVPWSPNVRGMNRVVVIAERQGWYERVERAVDVVVVECPQLTVEIPTGLVAPSFIAVFVTAKGQDQSRLAGIVLAVVASLDGEVILDTTNLTSSLGEIRFTLQLSHPGVLIVNITNPSQEWLVRFSAVFQRTVLGFTSITLTVPGQPVKQGSLVGIVATLNDYCGRPITGAEMTITVSWPNGTVYASAKRTTGTGGKCSAAYYFNVVGDFVINVSFAGSGMAAPSSRSEPQRVYVIPAVVVLHGPSCVLGEYLDLDLGLKDALGNYVPNRTLLVRIEVSNQTLFETQTETVDGLVRIHWTPNTRGLMSITVLHAGDVYYNTNSTVSIVSVMEIATANLFLSAKQVDMFGTVVIRYDLSTQGRRDGITVRIEVLGVDLVPLWVAERDTNGSGIVELVYTPEQAFGILTVQAEPATDECLLGAGTQKQLVVITKCQLSTQLEPFPPCASNPVNVSIQVRDELGSPIDGISVVVKVFDPYGQQVRLGAMSMSVTLPVKNGTARIEFTPEYPGLYTIDVSSSGSVVVHAFQSTSLHTVYSITSLEVHARYPQMEVGTDLNVLVLLKDHNGLPLLGRTVTMRLDGPGSRLKGPVDVTTNGTGFAAWTVHMDEIGLWRLDVQFNGIGVYLASSSSAQIDVRYGTLLEATLTNSSEIVAGRTLVQLSVLLSDSGGTPLEGFSMHYEVYHESAGLCLEGDIIQPGQIPVLLNLALPFMGNYTILVSFAGTTHYLPSSAAMSVWARGTTSVMFRCPAEMDRSDGVEFQLAILDESGSEIALNGLGLQLQITGPNGSINLAGLSHINGTKLVIPLRGFQVGNYRVRASVSDSRQRLGCSSEFNFIVNTVSAVVIVEKMVPGILGQQHSVLFTLVDSVGDVASGTTVFVSLYDPEGREIYGSPLTIRTPVAIGFSGVLVAWTPSEIGNYALRLVFEGDAFRTAASAEIVTLVRYESKLEIQITSQITYGDTISLSVILSGPIAKIQGAEVTVLVSLNGLVEKRLSMVTNVRGFAGLSIEGLTAGNHTVLVMFDGSSTYGSCLETASLAVLPVVSIKVLGNSDAVVGSACLLTVQYMITGLSSEWTGRLSVDAFGPDDDLIREWVFQVVMNGSQQVIFVPEKVGHYRLNVILSGLPVLVSETRAFGLTVGQSVLMQIDESTVPTISEVGIVAVVALALSRKLKRLESSMPAEWEP